jgi:phosphoribosyl 1,2-cyclic phosphodiesterase
VLVASLGSGSAGNCCYVESDGTALLVDAGFSARETDKRLASIGRQLSDVRGILVTHEHYDHIRGAETMARKFGIPVYLTRGTLDSSTIKTDEIPWKTFANNSSFRIGEIEVHARKTVHDATDSACFVLEARDGTRVGIASDLGCVDAGVARHLKHCDALLFESNYDVDMLRDGTYPWSLKRRIMSNVGHLSNEDAMKAVERLIGPELQALCLIHLSEKNNHESIARTMAEELLQRLGAPVKLSISKQHGPVNVIALSRRQHLPVVTARPAQLALF